jgi:cysteine-rich repeat protein
MGRGSDDGGAFRFFFVGFVVFVILFIVTYISTIILGGFGYDLGFLEADKKQSVVESASLSPGPCGDSVINDGETCDDGNANGGDGCSDICLEELSINNQNIWDCQEGQACTWIPPIGIPRPSFGIHETHYMYETPGNQAPGLTYTQGPNGPYTHYVDNSGSCSFSGDGTPSNPRCTIPASVPAGSVVEVHGGPYNDNTCDGGKTCMAGAGTATYPIFYRGINNAVIRDRQIRVGTSSASASYLVVEGFDIDQPNNYDTILIGPNLVFRNNEVRGNDLFRRAGAAVNPGSNSVFFNNHIHNLGQWDYTAGEGDFNGFSLIGGTQDVWMVDNHIHHMGGDGVGSCHSCRQTASYYYIGRNNIHDNGENALDFKEINNVVVSQNEMHDMYGFGVGAAGGNIVPLHSGSGGSSFHAREMWFLFNEMYAATDTGFAITQESEDIYIIGNVFYGIDDPSDDSAAAIGVGGGTDDIFVVGNTFDDVDAGVIDGFEGRSHSTFIVIEDNIFGNLMGSGSHFVVDDGDPPGTQVNNNLFEEPLVVGHSCSTCCTNCLENVNPGFVDEVNRDFRLQSSSPAIDQATLSSLYQLFEDTLGLHYENDLGQPGINIRVDYGEVPRPQGPGWDIGAFEFLTACVTNGDCSDSNACNGLEICNAGTCQAGTPINHDDGAFCNGLETCDPSDGSLIPGTPPVIDDGYVCTVDSCDEINDIVVNSPDHAYCVANVPGTDMCGPPVSDPSGCYDSSTGFLGFAVLGDSNSDEYRADDNRGGAYMSVTFNWVEALVILRSANIGPWGTRGETRRTGYENNWARTGANMNSMLTGGQHTNVAAQIVSGDVSHVVIHNGINDFNNNGAYSTIYSGALSGAALQTFIDGVVADLTTAVDTLLVAGAAQVVVTDIIDPGNSLNIISSFPDPVGRQLVTDAVDQANSQIATMLSSRPLTQYLSMRLLTDPIIASATANGGFYDVGGELIDMFNSGDEPHNGQLGDSQGHSGTVMNGLFANFVFINPFNTIGLGMAPLTDQEILNLAGISPSVCGNNVREAGEVCDGSDLVGESCLSQGFDGGSLSCASDCLSFDTVVCFDNPCVLTDASWSGVSAVEDDIVQLNVAGSDCNGETVDFVVWEDDLTPNPDDPVALNPVPVVFPAVGDAIGTWTAEWQSDVSGNPEYYFIASLASDPAETISSVVNPLLSVSQIVTSVCGNGLIEVGEQCDDLGTTGGDGCNSVCQIESGYSCSGEPSVCNPIIGGLIYVDGSLGSNCLGSYDVASRSCGGGTEVAYNTLVGAANVAVAGDVVPIRAGTYTQQLVPANSGTAGNYITFENYLSESVFIDTGTGMAIDISNRDYLILDGLRVDGSSWLEARNSHNNIIRNCEFRNSPASGTTGNVRFIQSNNNRVMNSILDGANDNIVLIDSNYNVVEGNTITEGIHSVWGIRCGDFNIIRNNYFENSQQKIGEVYDCGSDTTQVPNSFDSTKHNVIEGNIFALTAPETLPERMSQGNGIQYGGQEGIIRNNIFYNNRGPPLGMQVYGDESLFNVNNRIYSNVFHQNTCGSIDLASPDNAVSKNNIMFSNEACGGGGNTQVLYRSPFPTNSIYDTNNIIGTAPGQNVFQMEFGGGDLDTLAFMQGQEANILNNIEVIPGFVDAVGRDYNLLPGSPMIDAGTFLTTTSGASSGVSMAVADARYFFDGFGISGEVGDIIELDDGQTARILSINYATNTLTLDASLTWSLGQGIALAYSGSAPDIGAFEFAGTSVCGNNVQEVGEICDGSDLVGESCLTQGFGGGTLACAGDCLSFDVSSCTQCSTNADCNDGVSCTSDICTAGVCSNTANNAACDDGLFCNGAETCDVVNDCQLGAQQCTAGGESCNEGTDSCDICTLTNAEWIPTGTIQNQLVTLRVEGVNCDAEQINFVAWENDLFPNPDDPVALNPGPAVFSGGVATTSWNAEWQCDGDIGGVCIAGNPEYFFEATLNSASGIIISSELLVNGELTTVAESPTCGNSIQEGTEQCDDGNQLSGDGCSASCVIEFCGDGSVNNGEVCELWGLQSCTIGGYAGDRACLGDCSGFDPTCVANEFCGDSVVQGAAGETCDAGVLNGQPNQCNSQCDGTTASVCGNNIQEAGEDCDAGAAGSSQCSTSCSFTVCGDGVTQDPNGLGVSEVCDDGALNGQPNQCNSQCLGITSSTCQNGVIEAGEQCDDGNGIDTDACTNACMDNICGDGITYNGIEECDDGVVGTEQCTPACTLTFCGDSAVQNPNGNGILEVCDSDTVACSSSGYAGDATCQASCLAYGVCVLTESCGDGVIQSAAGETCDDAALNGQPGQCNSQCDGTTASVCGNNIQEAGEDCDDGVSGSAQCSTSCAFTTCGDGTVQSPNGLGVSEVCDDGALNGQPNQCNSQCDGTTASVCGNSVTEAGEECDGTDDLMCGGSSCDVACACIVPPSPTVQILSPLDSEDIVLPVGVNSTNVTVVFNTASFSVGGKGSSHAHFQLTSVPDYSSTDDFMFYNSPDNIVEMNLITGVTVYATWIDANTLRFNNVPIGQHNLTASLVDSSHVLLGNAEAQTTISFTVTETLPSTPICGDGNVDTGLGETCDDGNTNSGDGCDGSCHTESSESSGGGGGGGGGGSIPPREEIIEIIPSEVETISEAEIPPELKVVSLDNAVKFVYLERLERLVLDIPSEGVSYIISFDIVSGKANLVVLNADYEFPEKRVMSVSLDENEVYMGTTEQGVDSLVIALGLDEAAVRDEVFTGPNVLGFNYFLIGFIIVSFITMFVLVVRYFMRKPKVMNVQSKVSKPKGF